MPPFAPEEKLIEPMTDAAWDAKLRPKVATAVPIPNVDFIGLWIVGGIWGGIERQGKTNRRLFTGSLLYRAIRSAKKYLFSTRNHLYWQVNSTYSRIRGWLSTTSTHCLHKSRKMNYLVVLPRMIGSSRLPPCGKQAARKSRAGFPRSSAFPAPRLRCRASIESTCGTGKPRGNQAAASGFQTFLKPAFASMNIRLRRGRYKEVEAILRSLLAKEPDDGILHLRVRRSS